MATFETTATAPVAAPVQRTWELLCETRRYAEWVAGTEAVTRTDGPAVLGGTYDEVNPIAGPWKGKSQWTITEFDAAARRQVHHGEISAPTIAWLEIEMSAADTGAGSSEVTLTLSGESALGPVGVVMLKLLEGQVRKDNEQSARNFSALVS